MESTLKARAGKALAKEIGRLILEFRERCQTHADEKVEITNQARQIGILVQEWAGREQLSFDFWHTHKSELPKGVTWQTLKTFVTIARKLPKPAAKLEDCRRVFQQDFEAAGLLQLPERTQAQSPMELTPFMELANRIGALREVIVRWDRNFPIETWDAQTRAEVKVQLQPLVDFYAKL